MGLSGCKPRVLEFWRYATLIMKLMKYCGPIYLKSLLRYIRCWLQVLPVCTGEDSNTKACSQHSYPSSLSALCHLCRPFRSATKHHQMLIFPGLAADMDCFAGERAALRLQGGQPEESSHWPLVPSDGEAQVVHSPQSPRQSAPGLSLPIAIHSK